MRRLALLSLLLPIGCSTAFEPPVSDHSPQAICTRAVDNDKKVRELRMLSGTNAYLQDDLEWKLRDKVRQVYADCMAEQGHPQRGGVERIDPD